MVQLENEIWKPIKENPVYLVSNLGRVKTIDHPVWCSVNNSYSIRKGRFCALSNNNSKKYWRVAVQINNKQKRFAVHRLVAEAFIPNPNNLPQINHIDGNKDNNCVENLEWCDNSYNQRHAIEHKLKDVSKMSAHSSFRKLTEEQVCFIKLMWNSVDSTIKGEKERFCKVITEMFNLKSLNTIRWILNGSTNKFFNQDIVQTTNYNSWLSEYNRLWEAYKPQKTRADYARELGVIYSSFTCRWKMFNKDLDATINYFRRLKGMQ